MVTDLAAFVESWRRRIEDAEKSRQQSVVEAVARVGPAVELLVDRFGVTRVVLFGSAAKGTARDDSDVDLAVEGLPPERWVEALLALEELLGAGRVDLVDLDEAGRLLRAKVAQDGVVLHG